MFVSLCMAIGVLGAPYPSPMWQNDNDSVRHEPPLKGKDKVEPHDAAAMKHKDIMNRATSIFHEAAGHKQIATKAGLMLHGAMQPVNLKLKPGDFKNPKHGELQTQLKGAAGKLRELLPSVKDMHDEVHSHSERLRGAENQELHSEASEMRKTLKSVGAWATNHGEDAPGTVKEGRNFMEKPTHQPTLKLMLALHQTEKEIKAMLEKHPKAETPAQPLQDHANKMMTSPSRGGSSRPHH